MELDTNPTKQTKCVRLIRSPTYRELTVSDYVICIGGDININFLNYKDAINITYFYDSVYSLNLYPTITKPTRISSTNSHRYFFFFYKLSRYFNIW